MSNDGLIECEFNLKNIRDRLYETKRSIEKEIKSIDEIVAEVEKERRKITE